MRVLLLSAYDAASHRYWRDALLHLFPNWQWQNLVLPPRYFNWRLRSNALTWSQEYCEILSQDYDVVLATSMVDLATLRGLCPAISAVPNVLYFHENQFAYPPGVEQKGLLELQMTSIYSALSADKLLFNSAYNRDTFMNGVDELLNKMPDAVPKGVVQSLCNKSQLLPVPVLVKPSPTRVPQQETPHLLWNHRWEYDKAPERLLAALKILKANGVDFRLSIVGQQFRRQPSAFKDIKTLMSHKPDSLIHFGYMESRGQYLSLLEQADIVLSTALHDFQGLSVLEAAICGCFPIVPDRLAYREYLPENCRYRSEIYNPEVEAEALAGAITRWQALNQPRCEQDFSDFSEIKIRERYRQALFF